MAGDASEQPEGVASELLEKKLPTPSEIAREAGMDAATNLKTAKQFPSEDVGMENSSLLYPPLTPRRRR
jgi:hypothetical protein